MKMTIDEDQNDNRTEVQENGKDQRIFYETDCEKLSNQEVLLSAPSIGYLKTSEEETKFTTVERGPDGGWGWVCVFGAFCIQFIYIGIFVRSFGLIYLAIGQRFPDSPDSVKAWIPALILSLSKFLSPVASMLGTKYSPRLIMIIGGVLISLGAVLSAFATSPYHLILTLGLLCGTGGSFSMTFNLAIVGQYFEKKLAIANGLVLIGASMGGFIMPYLLDFLLGIYGLEDTFIILGALSLHILPCSMLIRPVEWYTRKEVIRADNETMKVKFPSAMHLEKNANEVSNKENGLGRWKYINIRLLKNLTFISTMLTNCFKCCSVPLVFQFLPSLVSKRGVSIMQASVLLSIMAICDCVSRLSTGWFVYATKTKVWVLTSISMGMCCLMVLFMAIIPTYEVTAACCAAFGFFLGCQVCLMPTILSEDHGKDNLTSAIGISRAFLGIFTLLPMPLLGWIRDETGSFEMTYIVMSSLLLLACISASVHPFTEKFEEKRKTKNMKQEYL